MMKQFYRITSYVAITIFAVLWIGSKFVEIEFFDNQDIRSLCVLVYLFTSLKFYQIESKEKDAIIASLKSKSA